MYQWQRGDAADGTYEDIEGATEETYTLVKDDTDCYIRVIATGTDGYTGTITSTAIGPVEPATPITAIDIISGDNQVGSTLTAGILTPVDATVEFQWQRSSAEDGVYEDIEGAAGETYTLTEDDIDCYIRVTATGTDGYIGTVTSDYVGPVAASEALLIIPETEVIINGRNGYYRETSN